MNQNGVQNCTRCVLFESGIYPSGLRGELKHTSPPILYFKEHFKAHCKLSISSPDITLLVFDLECIIYRVYGDVSLFTIGVSLLLALVVFHLRRLSPFLSLGVSCSRFYSSFLVSFLNPR